MFSSISTWDQISSRLEAELGLEVKFDVEPLEVGGRLEAKGISRVWFEAEGRWEGALSKVVGINISALFLIFTLSRTRLYASILL